MPGEGAAARGGPDDRPARRARTEGPIPSGWPAGFAAGERERAAALLLAHLRGIAPLDLLLLAHRCGTASRAVDAIAAGRAGTAGDRDAVRTLRAERLERRLAATGVRFVAAGDLEYPRALLDLTDPPLALFARGAPLDDPRPAVALVGARACTPYGRDVAESLGRGLTAAGVPVVSGAARGIDAAAHRGALAAGGPTVAVLGSGIDVPFPSMNRGLLDRVCAHGTLVTEYPPGTEARRHHFPARNRIVAALARAVVVVEGATGSGSMITVDHAHDLGREVLAVPGPVTSPLSAVPLELIRAGAVAVRGAEDVLEELGLEGAAPDEALDLPAAEAAVLRAVSGSGQEVDRVAAAAGLTLPDALSALLRLEVRGLVRRTGGRFERTMLAAG